MNIFKKYFSSTTYYVKMKRNRFTIRHVDRGIELELAAREAFTSRRLLVGEFTVAERLLAEGFKHVFGGVLTPSPRVVIHPLEMVDGGLSEVEERVLRELAAGAGARQVVVWLGHILSDQEVLAKLQ